MIAAGFMEELIPVFFSLRCIWSIQLHGLPQWSNSSVKKPQRIPERFTLSLNSSTPRVLHWATTCTCRCQQDLQGCIHRILDLKHKHLRLTTDEVELALLAEVFNLLSNSPEVVEEMVTVESDETEVSAKDHKVMLCRPSQSCLQRITAWK